MTSPGSSARRPGRSEPAAIPLVPALAGACAPGPDGIGGELRELVYELTGCGKVFVAGSRNRDEAPLDHWGQRSPLDVVWLADHGEFRQDGDHVSAFDESEHGAGV